MIPKWTTVIWLVHVSVLLGCLLEEVKGELESNCTGYGNGTVKLEGGTVNLKNGISGRVLVCWEDMWKGLNEDCIRTTQQANDICQMLGHTEVSRKGAEIIEAMEGPPNITNVYCIWTDRDIDYCTTINMTEHPGCHSNKIAAIMCKTTSKPFTSELIVLTVLVPLLLCVIAVGTIVVIHFIWKIKRLNVIIHRLIYKQQRIKAGLLDASLDATTLRSSMYAYARPGPVTGTQEKSNSLNDTEMAQRSTDTALAGPSQYSLLGNDKYENVDLNEIKAAQ